MNRLLIFTVLALTVVYQVSGVPRKPGEPISAHCGMLVELRQVMLDNPGLEKRSPRNYWCGTALNNRKSTLCSCNHHTFLKSDEANNFLKRGVEKRSLSEECCHEGCYYEEVYELC
ncbi:uncharacterized protein LOC119720809 [Patiria miniata]|uniref:Insulin-like domain-containing protein n=1 Tax=Patiria miniata TaxID=46514 RepID=A0A913Z6F5_PATMI|nr:uncharacterized protein LOC119720809 [Patiria miniata]